uniref:Uncharacterized protein n=1 Tax=Anguilla anguilla TaxID=7936 RepID=A0A0E9QFY0_ANGAN
MIMTKLVVDCGANILFLKVTDMKQ